MSLIKRIKDEVGNEYSYHRSIHSRDIKNIDNYTLQPDQVVLLSYVTAGCIRMESVLLHDGERKKIQYDFFVKDIPESSNWIFYGSANCENDVKKVIKETNMLQVLDQFVSENNLSYTKCCFSHLDGFTDAELKAKAR